MVGGLVAACLAGWLLRLTPARDSEVVAPRNMRASTPTGFSGGQDLGVGSQPASRKSERSETSPVRRVQTLSAVPEFRSEPRLGSDPGVQRLPQELPGRRIPTPVSSSDLGSPALPELAVPLPEANTLAHLNFQRGRFGRLQRESGEVMLFNPEMILVRFKAQPQVAVLRVSPDTETGSIRQLLSRSDVEFAELDVYQTRQFAPKDPSLDVQWHHAVLGSSLAWDRGFEFPGVRVAVVDTPFQMNHPDLAGNTVEGWDVVVNAPVAASAGIAHSTLCAGLIAATLNNGAGGCGIGNFRILPININGAISEMYHAILWAADHGVRVVNISWTGGDSSTLQTAAQYLKSVARGILVMAGVNGTGSLNYVDQPDIYCVAMTDAADNVRSRFGPHIDFAAPGWQIYSTTVGGGYAYDSGSSYATAVFSGAAAFLFGLNPELGPDQVVALLKATASDLGPLGRDPFFGWGRVSVGEASRAVFPDQLQIATGTGQRHISARYTAGMAYELWRATDLASGDWLPVADASIRTNGNTIQFTESNPGRAAGFYQVRYRLP